jgi:hypothetical protein
VFLEITQEPEGLGGECSHVLMVAITSK